MKTMTILGTKLNYRETNSEAPNAILFLHGNSHSLESFSHQENSPELKNCHLIFVDLPGHGESSPLNNYSVKNLAQIISEFCSKITTKKIVIAGHSLGGHVAINTLKHIDPAGLFLFGTPPLKNPVNVNAFLPNEKAAALRKSDADHAEIEAFMHEMNYSGLDKAQGMKDYLRTDSRFRTTILDDILSNDHEDEIELIKTYAGQMMFLLATKDSLINNNYIKAELEAGELSNCTVLELAAGHSVHVERPLEFNRELAHFCELTFKEKIFNNTTNERDYGEQRN